MTTSTLNVKARLELTERTLAVTHAELERLELEHARYQHALRRIAASESGVWGVIAHHALHPGEKQDPR